MWREPRRSTSRPTATMSRNMSLQVAGDRDLLDRIRDLAVLDPEAGGAARVVAGHRVDALPELLGDEEAASHAREQRRQVVVAGRDARGCGCRRRCRSSSCRACARSSCRGNSPARRRRARRRAARSPRLRCRTARCRARAECAAPRGSTRAARTPACPSESSRNDDLRYRLPPDTACTKEPIRSAASGASNSTGHSSVPSWRAPRRRTVRSPAMRPTSARGSRSAGARAGRVPVVALHRRRRPRRSPTQSM